MTAESETVLVAETGLGRYQVEARMGDSALLIDEPVAAGGLGSGPNPYDMIGAAVGACTRTSRALICAWRLDVSGAINRRWLM